MVTRARARAETVARGPLRQRRKSYSPAIESLSPSIRFERLRMSSRRRHDDINPARTRKVRRPFAIDHARANVRSIGRITRPQCARDLYAIIENYLVTRLIDSDPLTRSYITRARGLSLPFVHRPCGLPAFVYLLPLPYAYPLPSRRPFRPRGPRESLAVSFPPTGEALARRLSRVRSTNKSNTPRFVPRESSSFTIHEFIMGTTEDTAGPPLLIYRYAYPYYTVRGPDPHERT